MTTDDKSDGEGLDIYVPQVESVSVDEIHLNAWNPNEQAEVEFDLLVENIKNVGFVQPVQVVPMNSGGYRMIGGSHRLQAAKVLGMTHVPCVVLSDARWEDEDLQKFATVRLNQLHGRPNTDKMLALYREMASKYGEKSLQRMFAYTEEDAWKKLVRQVKKSIKASGLPEEAKKKFSNQSKDAKTVDDLSQVLNTIFNEHGDTLKHSFMVFSFGGKEHVYLAMTAKTKKALDQVLTHCKEWDKDVNQLIAPITLAWLEEAKKAEQEELEASSSG